MSLENQLLKLNKDNMKMLSADANQWRNHPFAQWQGSESPFNHAPTQMHRRLRVILQKLTNKSCLMNSPQERIITQEAHKEPQEKARFDLLRQ